MEKSTFTREYKIMRYLLRKYRNEAGLTQVEVAAALDESQSYVSKCERGERRLDLVQVRAFCAAIKVDLLKFVAAFEAAVRRAK